MEPATIRELQAIVRECPKLMARGRGTKTALRSLDGAEEVSLSSLSGILEYQPEEYTFTALAGTPVCEVEKILAEHGQYLPFDPVLVDRGATLGGTVASGLSGPGRFRYGGVRDFILAVQFVDGQGHLVRGGGKVVKNAAGFDLPKLMVGSLGAYGALVELTFKIFPRPEAFVTYESRSPSLSEALDALIRLTCTPLDLFALDLELFGDQVKLQVRLGGSRELFPQRIERLRRIAGPGEVLEGEPEEELWRSAREFTWVEPGNLLVKAPLVPDKVPAFDTGIEALDAPRRYSVGANLAWVSWPGTADDLDRWLSSLGLSGLAILGSPGRTRLGIRPGEPFARRVKQALDPLGRWLEV